MSEGAAYINSPPVWVAEVVKNEPLVLGSRRSWNGRPNSPYAASLCPDGGAPAIPRLVRGGGLM